MLMNRPRDGIEAQAVPVVKEHLGCLGVRTAEAGRADREDPGGRDPAAAAISLPILKRFCGVARISCARRFPEAWASSEPPSSF